MVLDAAKVRALYTLLLCVSSDVGELSAGTTETMRGGEKHGNFLKRSPYQCLRKLCFVNLKSALTLACSSSMPLY